MCRLVLYSVVVTTNKIVYTWPTEAPSFARRMENKLTREGETTVLECMSTGSPRPRITWLKDGVTLTPTLRHFFTADDQLLVIVHSEASDSGDYTCLLTNTLGSDRQVRFISISRPARWLTSSATIAVIFQFYNVILFPLLFIVNIPCSGCCTYLDHCLISVILTMLVRQTY